MLDSDLIIKINKAYKRDNCTLKNAHSLNFITSVNKYLLKYNPSWKMMCYYCSSVGFIKDRTHFRFDLRFRRGLKEYSTHPAFLCYKCYIDIGQFINIPDNEIKEWILKNQ